MIRDQRYMQGNRGHGNADDVVAFWQRFAAEHGFVRDETGLRIPGNLVETTKPIEAYVNHNRWVADCEECNGGIACWPEHPKACCLDCGTVFPIEFPDPDELQSAVETLEMRPDTGTRNWNPHRGETAQQLRYENIRNGVVVVPNKKS